MPPPCEDGGDETQSQAEKGFSETEDAASPSASPCDAENVHREGSDRLRRRFDQGADLGVDELRGWLAGLAESDLDGLATVLRGCLTAGQRLRLVELLAKPDQETG